MLMLTLEIETCGLLNSPIGFQKLGFDWILKCTKFSMPTVFVYHKNVIKTDTNKNSWADVGCDGEEKFH